MLAVAALLALAVVAALVVAALWPWKVEATLKATTQGSVVSLAGGAGVAGLSASAAAILGGPGVLALHLRTRELWRRAVPQVSLEALLAWLDEPAAPAKPPGRAARLAKRAKDGLLARTDTAQLPGLGLTVVRDLRDVALAGTLLCGFEDPSLTGKAAAVLYPLSALLAPFGTFEASFDWSGRTVLDGGAEISFRIVPARVLAALLGFAWRHVHLRRKRAPVSSTLPVSSTT
ncbi:MAG TPA: hypothetical protein VLT33_12070 [Labilithrix sp.]|nr:hypothetical protein [Labilithrix sp.]